MSEKKCPNCGNAYCGSWSMLSEPQKRAMLAIERAYRLHADEHPDSFRPWFKVGASGDITTINPITARSLWERKLLERRSTIGTHFGPWYQLNDRGVRLLEEHEG